MLEGSRNTLQKSSVFILVQHLYRGKVCITSQRHAEIEEVGEAEFRTKDKSVADTKVLMNSFIISNKCGFRSF